MSGGTLSGLSGSGVATTKINTAKPAVKSTTNSTTSTNETSQITTNTGSPGAQKQTSGEDFSNRLATNMAAAAANPYTAPATATPTQQGIDPAMMAMMSGMGGQKPQSSEQGGSKAGSQGSQAEQALQEMAQRFNNFRKEAGEKIAELSKGNKESPGDKVVEKALEKLNGKQAEPEKKKDEEKNSIKPVDKTTSDISDGYDENAFIA